MKAMNFTSVDYGATGEYLGDTGYAFEQKMDGTRALIKISPDGFEVLSRNGGPLKHTAALQHVKGILAGIPEPDEDGGGSVIIDGEIMIDTGMFYAFDMPMISTPTWNHGITTPYVRRRATLARYLDGRSGDKVAVVPTAVTPLEKNDLLAKIEAGNGEGIMIKNRHSPYEPGVRARHSFKAKLIRSVDVVVMEVDRPDPKHGSITFGVYDGEGQLKQLSNCSAIGKPEVAVGDVIEVAYLAWTPGGGLREPRMMRVREDKDPVECREDQLVPYSKAVV